MDLNSIIVMEVRPANQVEMDKKFISRLLEQWDGRRSFVEYLSVTLPVMWAGYVKLN